MGTVKSTQNLAGSGAIPPLFQSATRETLGRTATSQSIPKVKKVFELRIREGKCVVIESPRLRVTPDLQGFNTIEAFEGGVWSPVLTTPYYFDLTTKEA